MFLASVGCGLSPIVEIGAMATMDHNDVNEKILIKNPPPDLLAVAASVGESMGYRCKTQNPAADMMVQLESKIGPLGSLITGVDKTVLIMVMRDPQGLDIHVMAMGSFGAGSHENAKKVLAEYKEKLLTRLAQP
jgi:hypothetical protein